MLKCKVIPWFRPGEPAAHLGVLVRAAGVEHHVQIHGRMGRPSSAICAFGIPSAVGSTVRARLAQPGRHARQPCQIRQPVPVTLAQHKSRSKRHAPLSRSTDRKPTYNTRH